MTKQKLNPFTLYEYIFIKKTAKQGKKKRNDFMRQSFPFSCATSGRL